MIPEGDDLQKLPAGEPSWVQGVLAMKGFTRKPGQGEDQANLGIVAKKKGCADEPGFL